MTRSHAAQHNEGTCDLCTGWHDAEEAAFMNRRASQAAQEKLTSPQQSMPVTLTGMALHQIKQRDRLHGSPCYCEADAATLRHWHDSESLPDDRHSAITDEAAAATPSLREHRPIKRIRNRQTEERCMVDGEFWPCSTTTDRAAATTPSLDPRRFGKAIRNTGTDWNIGDIGRVLNEYDALSASSEPSKDEAAGKDSPQDNPDWDAGFIEGYKQGRADAEASGKDSPATPSLDRLSTALDALEAAMDADHPEGCACDLCNAATDVRLALDAIAVEPFYPARLDEGSATPTEVPDDRT